MKYSCGGFGGFCATCHFLYNNKLYFNYFLIIFEVAQCKLR
jgi:hypothetical protein